MGIAVAVLQAGHHDLAQRRHEEEHAQDHRGDGHHPEQLPVAAPSEADRRVQHARHRRQPRASVEREDEGEHRDQTDDEQHVASCLRSRLRDGAQRERQRHRVRGAPFVRVDERGLRTVDRVGGERASRRGRRRDEVGDELVCEQRWRHQAAGDRREGDVGHDHADHPADHGQHEEARHDPHDPIGRQIGPGGVQDIEEQQPAPDRASLGSPTRTPGGRMRAGSRRRRTTAGRRGRGRTRVGRGCAGEAPGPRSTGACTGIGRSR